ncbi:MAG TPA: M56 family metallopeptidase [Bryobacteraceae bacterium]
MNAIHLLSDQPWVERLGWTLVHFLWQGILIALVYAAARKVVRQSQPRYVLACAALAFLIAAPIVTFRVLTPATSVAANPYVGKVPASSAAAAATTTPTSEAIAITHSVRRDVLMPWVVALWFAGAIVFWVRLTGGWLIAARMRRISIRQAPADWQRTLDRLKTRIGISRPAQLLVSALVQAPTVIGWLRPIVLMPVGALAGLPAEHVEMLLAHELAHIRRHDYLVNVLQSIAEALLFYHPAVWWISGHIRAEREVCCDNIAVAITGDAFTYACALADLASRRPAFMNAALAANGGSLPERIGRLLNQPVRPRPRSGAAVVATLLLGLATWGLLAQSQPVRKFEAVTIKPNELGGGHSHSHSSDGRWNASMTTKSLIEFAFGIKSFQLEGGPGWLDENNYDFVASTGDATHLTGQTLQPYLQSLLSDRFHLVYHRTQKEFSVYALMTAKGGPKLTPSTGDEKGEGTNSNGNKGVIHMTGQYLTMASFASFLASEVNRPVIDRTGIQGRYDVKLDWSTGEIDTTLPAIFTALQEQMGLRLEATKGPVEILVIDSVDKPSEN